jgi:hypothetical protein
VKTRNPDFTTQAEPYQATILDQVFRILASAFFWASVRAFFPPCFDFFMSSFGDFDVVRFHPIFFSAPTAEIASSNTLHGCVLQEKKKREPSRHFVAIEVS